MVYQPMLELLGLLDGHGFSCWIFSGGGTDFMRAFATEIYGLPPYRVAQRGVIRTFQAASVFPRLTVLENLLLGARPGRGETIAVELDSTVAGTTLYIRDQGPGVKAEQLGSRVERIEQETTDNPRDDSGARGGDVAEAHEESCLVGGDDVLEERPVD